MRKNVSVLVIACLLAVACGQKGSPASPSGSSGAAASSVSAGATITGRVAAGSVSAVSIAGTATSTAGGGLQGAAMSSSVDGSGQFTLRGVPTGTVQLQFTGPGTNASLSITNVTSQEQIVLTVRVSGATAEVDDNHRTTSDSKSEVEGKVVEVSAANRTLRIGDTIVSVPAGTPITNNSGASIDLSLIAVGDRVEAEGMMSGGTFVASKVKLESEKSAPSTGTGGTGTTTTVEVSGTVSGKTGTCPAISFMLGTTQVTTNASTKFDESACTSIANGDKAEVKGTKQSNGSVLASSVEVDDDDENEQAGAEVEIKGTLTAKSGTCPAVTLTVGSTTVTTNASTSFEDTSCTALAVKDSVEIKASKQTNGSLLAKKVEKKK